MDYYIDLVSGLPDADGKTPKTARKNYTDLPLCPGDTVLFKRDTFFRGRLELTPGNATAPITYGAYGKGKNPVFCGTVAASDPSVWAEISPNIWRLTLPVSEVCNFILDGGQSPATLRWEKEFLAAQGDWFDTRFGCTEQQKTEIPPAEVLLYSVGNPGKIYRSIEVAVAGARNFAWQTDYTVLQDLSFYGNGVHALSGCADHVTVRRCRFEFIGGAVWNKELKIRFGNAIEFWQHGEDILVEDCYFNEIYDSCVTVQGDADCLPAKNLTVRRNLFRNFGMAAYEGRDKMPVGSSFCDNLCLSAGGGFSALGDTVPRNSEIYPLPMGHALFFWRMTESTAGGGFRVENNLFDRATGAAVYAYIDDSAVAQMTFAGNRYQPFDFQPMVRLGSAEYSFEAYQHHGDPNADFTPFDPEEKATEWEEAFAAFYTA